jgi:Chromo (CHRromatin Organisation MOdifier) domain
MKSAYRDNAWFEVERIVDQRQNGMHQEYLIRWAGFGQEADSWVPGHEVNAPVAIQVFQAERAASRSETQRKAKQRRKANRKAREIAAAGGISVSAVSTARENESDEDHMDEDEPYVNYTRKRYFDDRDGDGGFSGGWCWARWSNVNLACDPEYIKCM